MSGTFRLSEFADIAGLRVVRDGPFRVTGKLSTPLDALCVPLRSAAYLDEVNGNDRVSAVITTAELADGVSDRLAVAVAERPADLHAEIHVLCAERSADALRATPNAIDPSARIDSDARIAAYGVVIGADVRVFGGATIEPGTTLDDGCVIHPGVVLGGPGFNVGIIRGRQRILPPLGGVHLKPFVELLANSTVARASFGGATTIGEETVADNLVYIAHDCQIGRQVQICANATLLGRVVVGDGAYIGPAATVVNGAVVGAKAKVTMGATVTRNVEPDTVVTGNFAVPHETFLANLRRIR